MAPLTRLLKHRAGRSTCSAGPRHPERPRRGSSSRGRCSFRWVDVVTTRVRFSLLSRRRTASACRRPLPGRSILEGRDGSCERCRPGDAARCRARVSAEDQQAYLETKLFKHELATRVGLPTRPQHGSTTWRSRRRSAGLRPRSTPLRRGYGPVVEALAPGGQAGTSAGSRTPRLSHGVSGAELAASIHAQATRLGAEVLVGAELFGAMPGESGTLELELTGGTTVRARAGIAANGVHYRRLETPASTSSSAPVCTTAARHRRQRSPQLRRHRRRRRQLGRASGAAARGRRPKRHRRLPCRLARAEHVALPGRPHPDA